MDQWQKQTLYLWVAKLGGQVELLTSAVSLIITIHDIIMLKHEITAM